MAEEADNLARHKSRVLAVQGLFVFLERSSGTATELLDTVSEQSGSPKADEFAITLLESALENIGKLKVVLRAYANQTKFDKIAPINKAVILLGLCEMKYFVTPSVVVINEYIDIAKAFGEEKSGGFVNGVLDQFRENLASAE